MKAIIFLIGIMVLNGCVSSNTGYAGDNYNREILNENCKSHGGEAFIFSSSHGICEINGVEYPYEVFNWPTTNFNAWGRIVFIDKCKEQGWERQGAECKYLNNQNKLVTFEMEYWKDGYYFVQK